MKLKSKKSEIPVNYDDPTGIKAKLISEIIAFLQMFIPVSLAKRITSVLLLLSGVPHDQVTRWTGACDRSVRQWKSKSIQVIQANFLKWGVALAVKASLLISNHRCLPR